MAAQSLRMAKVVGGSQHESQHLFFAVAQTLGMSVTSHAWMDLTGSMVLPASQLLLLIA